MSARGACVLLGLALAGSLVRAQSGGPLRPVSATPDMLQDDYGGMYGLMQQIGFAQAYYGVVPYEFPASMLNNQNDPAVDTPIPGNNPAINGSFKVVGTTGVLAIHAVPVATGDVLFMARPSTMFQSGDGTLSPTNAQGVAGIKVDGGAFSEISTVYSMANNSYTPFHIPEAPFCSGHTLLPDGRGIVVGGEHVNLQYPYLQFGGVAIRVFDPITQTIETVANLDRTRWYPTIITLPDGNILFLGGAQQEVGNFGLTMTPTSAGPQLVSCSPNQGGSDNADPYFDNPTYSIYNYTSNEASPSLALTVLMDGWPVNTYPYAYVLPSGSVFIVAGAAVEALFLTAEGAFIDDAIGPLPDLPVPAQFPYYASSALLPMEGPDYRAVVMIAGGTSLFCAGAKTPATQNSVLIDATPGADHSLQTEQMHFPRIMNDLVNLPDGTILCTGGAQVGIGGGGSPNRSNADKPSTTAELYDPAKPVGQRWTVVADSQIPRIYHSVSFLTPNAEVLLAGSETTSEQRVQIYTPAYLQNGNPRPSITSAPEAMAYNSNYTLGFGTTDTVDRVVLARLAGSTHGIHFDQRLVVLTCAGQGSAGEITCTSPPSGNIAPPGVYMLFVMLNGTPSQAAFVTINEDGTSSAFASA